MLATLRTPAALFLAFGGLRALISGPQAPAVGERSVAACTRGCGLPTPTPHPAVSPTPTPIPGGDCTTDSALCLGAGRFVVTAEWAKPDGASGSAHAVPLTNDSGYFWFLEPGNVELTVKALDGCAVNGFRWFFAAGLTNLEVRITVADLTDGSQRIYTNTQGSPFQTVTDTAAFETCAGELAPESSNPEEPFGENVAGDDTELWLNRRFRVEADWETASGRTGAAHAVPITDESGYFWFFDPGNVELVVKTLDACAIHSGTWFFGAGMTRVGVRLRVTDTVTGEVRSYSNPVNAAFAPIQDTSAFATCPTATPTLTPTPTPTSGPGRVYGVRVSTRGLNSMFVPSELHVQVGDTVRWTLDRHQTVSDTNLWDSGRSRPLSFAYTFRTPGTFPYHCNFDIHSPGVIVVDPLPAQARAPRAVARPELFTPTPTPTPAFNRQRTKTPTPVASPSRTPTVTATPTPTATRTATPSPSPSRTPTVTPTQRVTPVTHSVTVIHRGFYGFLPEELHVRVGERVHWDLLCHSDGTHHRTASIDGLWDSGAPGPSSFDYTFTTTGTFFYLCGLDIHFEGHIVVDP